MKQPRVTDFDPNAKVPKLSSPMDHLPTIERPKKPEPARDITRQLKQARDGTQSDELKQSSFFRPAQDSATRIQPKPAPSPTTPHSLDLLEIAHNDISVRLSDQELETIEDLKTDLRKKYRINVPKKRHYSKRPSLYCR